MTASWKWRESLENRQYYKLKTLEQVKKKNLVLGSIQENFINSIEFQVQNCLPYIC